MQEAQWYNRCPGPTAKQQNSKWPNANPESKRQRIRAGEINRHGKKA